MPAHFHKKVVRAVLLPLPLLLALSGLFLWQAKRTSQEARMVEHTRQVIGQIELCLRLLVDQETGLRGFLLTGDQTFLQPYEASRQRFPVALDVLRSLTSDNPAQQQRVSSLEKQFIVWSQAAEVERARVDKEAPITQYGDTSRLRARKAMMDDLRRISTSASAEEERLLAERRQESLEAQRTLMIGASIIFVLIGLFLVWYVRRLIHMIAGSYAAALREREASEKKERQARTAAEALAEEIAERSREMEKSVLDMRAQLEAARRGIAGQEGL